MYFFISFFFLKNFIFQDKINNFTVLIKDSFNYVNINICSKLFIDGMMYSNYPEMQNKINNYCNIRDFDIKELEKELLKDPWIKYVSIQKKFPDTLKIKITEYNPFAIFIDNKKNIKLIDEYGDIINIKEEEIKLFSNLVVIVGDTEKEEIYNIFNLLSIYNNLVGQISKIIRVNNRRWDLILKSNVVVQLPEENENMFVIWKNLDKLINIYGLNYNLKKIDLRIENKIYLKYNYNISTEIKNLK